MSVRTGGHPGWRFHFRQLWRNHSLRSSPIWLLVTALNTSVATGVLVFNATRDSTDVSRTSLLIVLWFALALFMLASRGRARCSELDMALPLSTRGLWLTHLAATVLSGLVAMGVSLGVVAAHELLVGTSVGWRSLLGPLTAGVAFVAVAIQSYQRDLRSPPSGRFNLVLVGSLAGVLVVTLVLIERPLAATLTLLVPAMVVGSKTLSALAPAFKNARKEPVAIHSRAVADVHSSQATTGKRRRNSWMTLFAILHHAPPWGRLTPWVLYGFMAAVGFVMAGGIGLFPASFDDRVLRFIYLPLASYSLFTGIGVLLYQSFRLEPLPISRRRLFALLILPTLGAFLVGFAGARTALGVRPAAQVVNYRIHGEYYWVDVPVRFLSFSKKNEVPVIEAPWGESYPAWSSPLFKGSDTVLYSPFNVSEPASANFEAFLASRAIESLHGRLVSPDEILERYFEVENDRPVGFKEGGFTLLNDYPGLVAPDEGPEVPAYLALVLAPWLLASAIFFRAFRAPANERRVKQAYWGILGLLLALVIGLAVAMIAGLYDAEATSALLGVGIRQLGVSSAATAMTWLASLSMIAVCYLLAERQYRRSELPARPIKLSLIDFAPGDS